MRRPIATIAVNGALIVLAVLTALPLLWMLSASLMPAGEAQSLPVRFLPSRPTLEHYATLFQRLNLGRTFLNSLMLASMITFVSLLCNSMAGYAFAKLRFRGRKRLFAILLATLVVPPQVTVLPLFLEIRALGLVNSFGGILVAAIATVFGIFLIRQFALGIPDELLDAARLDGASELPHLLDPRAPADAADPDDPGRLHVPFLLERFSLALDRADGREQVHAAGGPRQPFRGARTRYRADDGRGRRNSAPRPARLPGAPEVLRGGNRHGECQGMKPVLSVPAVLAVLAVLLFTPAAFAEDASQWTATPSDNVRLDIRQDGGALRLDFDFQGGAGYAVAHRPLALNLPANWEITFRLRADAPVNPLVNNLEFKLIDPTGENVWWVNRRNFNFPRDWQTIRIKRRQLEFAWGPIAGGEMKTAAALELAITAGTGGKGTVWIDDLTFTELPPDHPYSRTPAEISGADWTGLDFLESREYGGLVIDWEPGAEASRYTVEISDDGENWTAVRTVENGNGGRDYLYLPETESRYLRLRGVAPQKAQIGVKPLDWAPTVNDLFKVIAKDAPRGSYPRAFFGEQPYWTVVGVDGDAEEGLLGEDGALEVGQGAFSIEPFLWIDGQLVSWADVETTQSLAEGYLPIPTVTWTRGDLSLDVTAFASPSGLWARYLVRNRGRDAKRLRLFLALRPFQVNPPAQFLNHPGGVSSIREIAWDGKIVTVNGQRTVIPATAPTAFGASPFDGGEISESLRRGTLPGAARILDAFGYASGAFVWDLEVPGGGERMVDVRVPFDRPHPPAPSPEGEGETSKPTTSEPLSFRRGVGVRSPGQDSPDHPETFNTALAAATRDWHQSLDRVEIHLPPAGDPLVKTFKTVLAHILINRDGPAIQPGSRSYARTWIRDGSLTSAALLRAGHPEPVRQLIEWFAPFQFANGKVPCCVDSRGADPVPENDSHGEFLFLVAEYWRYTGDRATVEKVWPHVEKAVAYIDELRQMRRTDEYRQPDKLKYFGLLPESISHEGYSAKPVHSYWDDFFALTGLNDATDLARGLGKTAEADRWAAIRDEFRTDLHASIERVIAETGIDYIPASADLADRDPTSTTTAITPGGEIGSLPRPALERTFELYWQDVEKRKAGDWTVYTPYELRSVGTFIRLGWTERAHELLDLFMDDRRPPGWNQWPEVVFKDQRAPSFLGDLPHTWVGSDFMRSFLDLLAYERESDHALVLAAGVPAVWIAAPGGVAVRRLPTPWGLLEYSLTAEENGVRLRVGAGITVPPGGIVFGDTVIRKVPADVRPKSAASR